VDDSPAATSLRDVVEDIRTVAAAAGNEALSAILTTWADPKARAYAMVSAEAMLNSNASERVLRAAVESAARAARYLRAGTDGVVHPRDAIVRGWCTRYLWRLLALLKSSSLAQEEVRAAGGFDGYVLRGFAVAPAGGGAAGRPVAPPVSKLEGPVSLALMEILVDAIAKPSDNPTSVETFGKVLARPEQLRVVFRLLPTADWQVKHDVMKDLNVLLIKREDNFPRILEQPDWIAWLAPTLANLPRKPADRTELMNEFLKYVMNFFSMLLAYVFQAAGGAVGEIDRAVTRLIEQVKLQCGWGDAAIGVVRNVLASAAVKIAQNAKRWHRRYDRPEWDALFKVATVVEDFIFYRPASEDSASELLAESKAGGVPMILYVSPSLLAPTAPVALVSPNVEFPDRSAVGLHLNMQTGEADDLKLAQRVVAIFTEVGLTPDAAKDAMVAGAREKKAKDMLTHASGIMKVYTEIVSFLEDCNKSRLLSDTTGAGGGASDAAEKALIENLAKFLEKRQKQQRTGFMSRSASKKGIVQALQTSVMRQRAQQTIRTQVQATILATATVTTVTEVDDEEEEAAVAAARKRKAAGRTTAKRLQGTRAAVEAVPDAGGAGGAAGGAGGGGRGGAGGRRRGGGGGVGGA